MDAATSMRFVALLASAALLLAACGDDSGSGATGGDESCPQATVTLESGLKIEELECGEGAEAEGGDTVNVHYEGRLPDGTKFDASRDHPGQEPLSLKIGAGNVIEGFEDGVVGMRVGGRRRVIIPPELGYGDAGSPPAIPPNATLVFDIELVEIVQD